MNKNEKKEGKSSKGEKKTRKSTKVNKARGNENKMPAGEKSEKADDASNKFPNFSVLNDEEKSAFFQALTEARRNVQKRGGPVRERFGTVHDAYLEYFNRQEKKEEELPSPAIVLDAGDPPEAIEEKPRASTPPSEILLKPRGEAAILERCEAVIEEDTNKILSLYQKKKNKNKKTSVKKPKDQKAVKLLTEKETDEKAKKKEKNEKVPAAKASETSVNLRNTPRFDALNAEEKKVFFKILQEARNHIVEKNHERKKQILPMESIVKRYGGEVGKKSVFTAKQEPGKFGQDKKNLKVKVTLTSGDNDRLLKTIPESPPTSKKVNESKQLTTRRSDEEGLDLVDVSGIELRGGKHEEDISEHSIRKKTSRALSSLTTMKKSVSDEEKLRTKSSEIIRKGKTKKEKKTPTTTGKDADNRSNELNSTVSLSLRENSSASFPKNPGKKKSDGITNHDLKSGKEKSNENNVAEMKKIDSAEIKSVDLENLDERTLKEEKEEEENEGGKEVKRTRSENSLTLVPDKEKELRKAQTEDNLKKKKERKSSFLSLSELELEGTKINQMLLRPEKTSKGENELEDKESGEEQHEEDPSIGTVESAKREDTESTIPTEDSEEESKPKEENASVEKECSEEGSKEGRKESEKPFAMSTTKVMIVDDNVIDKIRNLIFYLEEKASRDDRLEAEYIKLVVDYVDYLSKVLQTLVLKKKAEETQNAFVAAQVHLKFDETERKGSKPESKKFVPRSVSEQDFIKHHAYEPQNQEEKKKKDDKVKERETKNDDLMFPSDSDSSQESDTEISFVPLAPTNPDVVTTKIRLLQDLINRRAEFVQSSTEDFKIIYHPQQEYVPVPKKKTVKIIKEEEDSPSKDNKMKLLRALIKFCQCGKKKVDEEGVFENLKGEAVRVDVTEDKRDAANITLNQSTIEVLKASGRKKIIEKYYSKE